MIRRFYIAAFLGLGLGGLCLLIDAPHAAADVFPCNITPPYGLAACQGYFSKGQGNSAEIMSDLDGVLSVGGQPAAAFTNVSGGGIAAANIFTTDMSNYLNSPNPQFSMGAAFIIGAMLSPSPGIGQGNGILYAKNNFNTWKALVDHYATAQAGATYGVNWSYLPSISTFCGTPYPPNNPQLNSTYLPNVNDDVFHASVCDPQFNNYGYYTGTPEIAFYWAGGSLDIGRPCGNIESSAGKVPIDHMPTGKVTVTCNGLLDQQVATFTFSDQDNPTFARLNISTVSVNGQTYGGQSYGPWGSPGTTPYTPPPFTIPKSSTSPWTTAPPQTVTLMVIDSGTVGDGKYYPVWVTNTQTPCVSLTCGTSARTPSMLDPYTTFTDTVTVSSGAGSPPPGATMKLQISPPAGGSFSYTSPVVLANWSGGTSTSTFGPIGPTSNAGGTGSGTFNESWTLTVGSLSKTCPGSFPVIDLPYIHVYGGDVMAGSSPVNNSGSTACGSDASAGVYSWNNHTPGNYSGAGASYAVQALEQILDFASGVAPSNAPPIGLSFANSYNPPDATKLTPGSGLFGGYAAMSSSDCDFTSDIDFGSASTQSYTTDTTIPSTTVTVGSQEVIYVHDADVYISGDIKYQNPGGWAAPDQIPLFKLVVVGGRIDIGSNVKELDGLYVSEPDNTRANGGIISTCSFGIRNWAQINNGGSGVSSCNSQLVVNGAFVAKYLWAARTYGTVGHAKPSDTLSNNYSAEVFNYTPELWLPRGGLAGGNSYDAITDLPPIL